MINEWQHELLESVRLDEAAPNTTGIVKKYKAVMAEYEKIENEIEAYVKNLTQKVQDGLKKKGQKLTIGALPLAVGIKKNYIYEPLTSNLEVQVKSDTRKYSVQVKIIWGQVGKGYGTGEGIEEIKWIKKPEILFDKTRYYAKSASPGSVVNTILQAVEDYDV